MAPVDEPDELVDHYAALGQGLSPGTPAPELRRAYHSKLRKFHPDKRPGSAAGRGANMTKILNEAWAILGSPEQRELYDARWLQLRSSKEKTTSEEFSHDVAGAWSRAKALRHEGNDLFAEAQVAARRKETALATSKYETAVAKYSEGLRLAPQQHQLWSNRALCRGRLRDWEGCRGDALQAVLLVPESGKAWFWLVKAIWRLDGSAAAQRQLQRGLEALPADVDLLKLQEELRAEAHGASSPGGVGGGSTKLPPPSVAQVPSPMRRRDLFGQAATTASEPAVESRLPEMPSIKRPPRPQRAARPAKVAAMSFSHEGAEAGWNGRCSPLRSPAAASATWEECRAPRWGWPGSGSRPTTATSTLRSDSPSIYSNDGHSSDVTSPCDPRGAWLERSSSGSTLSAASLHRTPSKTSTASSATSASAKPCSGAGFSAAFPARGLGAWFGMVSS